MPTKSTFSIRELSREFNLTARAIRFYEDQGLIAPARKGQTRLFSTRDRARLALISRGRRVGFSLAEIKEMLDLYDVGDGQTTQFKYTRKKFEQQIQKLEQQRADIEEAISELKRGLVYIESKLKEAAEAEERGNVRIIGYGVMPTTERG
jgi:DNA-binding transcriptional MerR regulator